MQIRSDLMSANHLHAVQEVLLKQDELYNKLQWQSLLHTKPSAQSVSLDTKSHLRFVFIALLNFASAGWKTEEIHVQVQSSAVLLRGK